MKKLLLLTLLCSSINGFAVNWKKVIVDRSGDSYYVDVENIKNRNGLLYYSRLEDYLEPKNGDYSFIRKFKVDCTRSFFIPVALLNVDDIFWYKF